MIKRLTCATLSGGIATPVTKVTIGMSTTIFSINHPPKKKKGASVYTCIVYFLNCDDNAGVP